MNYEREQEMRKWIDGAGDSAKEEHDEVMFGLFTDGEDADPPVILCQTPEEVDEWVASQAAKTDDKRRVFTDYAVLPVIADMRTRNEYGWPGEAEARQPGATYATEEEEKLREAVARLLKERDEALAKVDALSKEAGGLEKALGILESRMVTAEQEISASPSYAKEWASVAIQLKAALTQIRAETTMTRSTAGEGQQKEST